MNVTQLARKLHVNAKDLLEILPKHGFDIGKKAVKIDDKVAQQIMRKWKYIRREMEEEERRKLEERKRKERELRKEKGIMITLPELVTVRDFAERMGMPVTQLIVELMKNGILANQNQNIDYDTAAIIAEELGYTATKEAQDGTDEEKEQARAAALENALSKGDVMQTRPPVVVVMGHVDHGKTKLLDTIRQANIIDTEAGGITQHIGAYQTIWKNPKTKEQSPITFIDTPGHEAFTIMRSRGAKIADIAILVVAADDGVKPQTKEAIQIIKAAKLPYVVAINKIDKETADIDRVKTELSQNGVIPEDWGGEVPIVPISAKENLHIDQLLDMILLLAEVHADHIQADPNLPAAGTVIESHLDKNIGAVATVLIQVGTLRKNDALVVNGEIYGKIRAMRDYTGSEVDIAGPSTPVQIIGFKVAPEVGDVLDISKQSSAKKIDIKQKKNKQTGAEQHSVSIQSDDSDEDAKKTFNVVIKADVLGSLEAIIASLEKIEHTEVGVKIIGKGLGNITEGDVVKAEAGHGAVIGFNVTASSAAEYAMREKGVAFQKFNIIYDLIDWIKDELEKLLDERKVVTELGKMKVLAVFRQDKRAMTVGGRVEEGKIVKDGKVRVIRNGELMGYGKIATCQTGKQDVKEVPSGTECGIRYEGKVIIEKNDILEVYTESKHERKLEE